MAIQYIRIEVVRAGPDSSAVGASAYLTRELRSDRQTGRVFNFRANERDVLAKGIVLPADAPKWALEANGTTLWNAAQQAELLRNGSRYRHRAQLAYSVVLAMPKELSLELNRELLEEWIHSAYTSRELAVEWAINKPGPRTPDNVHARLLVATRRLCDDGFGAKVRGAMGCVFASGRRVAGDDVGRKWRTVQESFFAARGLDVTVGPRAAVQRRRMPRRLYEVWLASEYARQVACENELPAKEARDPLRATENPLEVDAETHRAITARVIHDVRPRDNDGRGDST